MKRIRFCVAVILGVALAAIAACSDDEVTRPGDQPTPVVPETFEMRVVRTNLFAFDLYGHLSASQGNLIVSPHSIATAFGMVYAGARGETEKEIARTLHFNYPPAHFHSVLKQLNDLLESRGGSAGPDAFRLHIANSAWGQEDLYFLPSYLDTISTCYGGMRYLDFQNQPEAARDTINEWVEDETEGLVQDLILPGKITPETMLVLANAIYFRASWLHQFDPDYTWTMKFTKLDGSEVDVSMMNNEGNFRYHDAVGYEAIALPYEGEDCSMLLILPDQGNYGSFEAALTPAKVDTILDELQTDYVVVHVPKFSFETEYDLNATLQAMGMHTAFAQGANFSGIDGTDDGTPWIDFVAHKAFIAVDEYGTLAAAGTAAGLSLGVHPEFYAARPFIFVIVDDETETILFLGRVLDPTAH